MDERVLVQVCLPAVRKHLELFLPAYVKIHDLHIAMCNLFEHLWKVEASSFYDSNWYVKQGIILSACLLTVKEVGIQNADEIIIM